MDIKQFLSRKEQRFVNLLTYAMFTHTELSIDAIKELNQCSRRTAYNDVNEFLFLYGHILNLEFSKNTLTFGPVSYGNYHFILKEIMKSSLEIRTIEQIFYTPNISVSELALQTSTSESHVYRVLNRMNSALHQKNIMFDIDKLFFRSDDEENLRLFFTEFFYLTGLIEEDHPDFRAIEDFIFKKNNYFNDYRLNDHGKLHYFFILFLQVSFIRESQGFYIKRESDPLFEMNDALRSIFPNMSVSSFNNVLNHFLIKNTCMSVRKNQANLFSNFVENINKYKLEHEGVELKDTFNSIVGYLSIVCTVSYFPNYVLERAARFGNAIITRKPHFKEQFLSCLKDTFKDYDIDDHIEENMAVLVFIYMIDNPATLTFKRKKVFVYSDYGKYHEQSMMNYFKYYFSEHDYESFDLLVDENFDFVITTVQLTRIEREKQIIIDDFIGYQEIFNILSCLYY